MKGHIRERSPGKWYVVLDNPDPETGKRRRKWVRVQGGKREAQVECARLVAAHRAGEFIEPSRLTVRQFLVRWLEHVRSQVAPRSFERYQEIAMKNLAPLLGGVALNKLKPMHVSDAYAKALASGRRDGTGGLSARTVHHMHRVLRQALQQAVQWEMIARNPASVVKPPKVERVKFTTLDGLGGSSLLQHFRPTRLYIAVLLALACGLRRGEIAALQWGSIDLERGRLSVQRSAEQTRAGIRYKEPKTGRGRAVALPSLVVEELRRHRSEQAQELLRLGIGLSEEAYVVAQADGRPLQPNSITHEFVRIIGQSALPAIRFHDLRHTHATQLLAAGVHPKVAQERLGHSTIATTMDLYSHVMPGMQEEAAAKVDAVLRGALERGAS
jgi:integrase